MNIRKEKVRCPLLKKEIDEELCSDAAFVAEEFHPERFAPEEIRKISNWKEVCQNCENNPCNEEDI